MADVGIRISAVDATQGAFASINQNFANLQSQAATVANSLASIGVGLSAGAFVAFTKGVINSLDALNDLKDATGASIENISALENVAKRTGTSFDTVGTALVKLNQALNSAKPGSDAELAIKAIGLSVSELKKLDPAEAFQRIAVKLNSFADDGNKARLSQELFGKSLKEVAPLLKDVAEAGVLVATVTSDQADQAEKFNKQLFALEANASNAARTMVSELLPTLNLLAEEYTKAQQAGGGFYSVLGGVSKTVIEASVVLLSDVAFVLKGIGREIGAIGAQLVALGNLDIKGFSAISEAVKEDGIRARKELDDFQQRLLNPKLADTSAGAGRGNGYGNFVIPKATVGDFSGPDKEAIAKANAELKKQADLLATLSGVNADYVESLTRLQVIKAKGLISDERYVELITELINKQPMAIKLEKERTELEKARLAVIKASVDANLASADSIAEALKRQEEENASIGATVGKLRELEQAKLADALATAEQSLQEAIKANKSGEVLESITLQVEGLRKLIKAKKESYGLQDDAKAAKDAADAWTRASEQIEQSITDALMRGFENGKGFAENLADTVKNIFSTMILRPVVQGIVSGVTGQGGGGFGQAISTAQSIYNSGSALLQRGGTGDFLGDKLYDFGNSLSETTSGPLANFGSDLAANSSKLGKYAEQAGNALSYLDALSNFKDGSYGKSIGQAVGTYIGGPIAGQVGKAIGDLVDKLFSKGDYVQTLGGKAVTFDAKGNITSQRGSVEAGFEGATAAKDAAAKGLVLGLQGEYAKLAKSLGIGMAASFFDYGANSSDGGKFRIVGGAGGKQFDSGEIKTTDADLKLAASRVVFAALQGSDLPKYLQGAFDGMVASNLSGDQINAALDGVQALKGLHDQLLALPFTELQDLSYETTKALIGFSGGIEQLGQNLNAYYENFFSADEQLGNKRKTIAARLNAAGGNFTAESIAELTRPAFRAIVEQTDPSSPLYAALLSVAGVFAEITPVAATAAEAVAQATKGYQDLQDRLDKLTGTQTDRSLELRDAADETTRGLLRQIYAQEDLNAAASKFADAMGGLSSTSFDLQNQILELQGKGSEVRQRVRNSEIKALTVGLTDPAQIDAITHQYDYNEGLKDQITQLQQAAQAQEQMARAAEEAARASEQLRQAWQSVTDSIFAEVRRIRGLVGGNAQQTLAGAQAQFAITTAQARAGDQDAAKLLPALSQTLLTLAEANATSLDQLRLIQLQVAGNLDQTGQGLISRFGLSVPKLATGTNNVPYDMLVMAHKGEAVVPAAYNPALGGGVSGNDDVVAELQALRLAVAALQDAADKTATTNTNMDKTLTRVTRGGDNMVTKDYTVA